MLVMTSRATHDETVSHFERGHFFGLPRDDVLFFEQGEAPCLGTDGRVLLAGRGKLAMAPTGNGALYAALADSGVLAQLEERGVTTVHQFAVDNALVLPVDPVAVGAMAENDSELLVKCTRRASAAERVGVFAERSDGGLCVLEYSEIPEDLASKEDENGDLVRLWLRCLSAALTPP